MTIEQKTRTEVEIPWSDIGTEQRTHELKPWFEIETPRAKTETKTQRSPPDIPRSISLRPVPELDKHSHVDVNVKRNYDGRATL